jgi:hypothetical protein
MRNRDHANPIVALADALREAHPTMFGRGEASSVEEADALYSRVANRLINLGVRPRSLAEGSIPDCDGARAGESRHTQPLRGRSPGWRLIIERAWNGYSVADTTRTGSWLIVDDDPFEAAAMLLLEMNERLGSDGSTNDERRVLVQVVAGDAWLAAHPARCPHDLVRNLSNLESDAAPEGWACGCGVPFVPLAPDEREVRG